MDNTESWLSGLQLGGQWADRWARNRQQQIENQRREREDRDKLLAAFGEDAVLGGDGRVDVNASSIRRKERLDKEAAQAAEGFKAVYQSIPGASATPTSEAPKILPPNYQPEAPKTEAQSFDFLSTDETPSFGRRIVAPPITQAESDLPADRPRFVPVAESSRIRPPEVAPEPPPDQPRYIPVQAAPAIVPTDVSPAPRAMIVPNGAVLRPPDTVESSPLPPAAVASVPEPATAPRAILPPGTIQAPARPQIPDMTGWAPAKVKAFMAAYPKAYDESRLEQQNINNALARLEIVKAQIEAKTAQNERDAALKLALRDKITDAQMQLQDKKADLAENIQQMKGQQALAKQGLAPVKLEKADEKIATEYAATLANKQSAKEMLTDSLAIITNPQVPKDVRIATAKNTFKTLNSADYKSDAVSGAEEKRIGGLLGFNLTPTGWIETGHFAPDLPGFIQQVQLKVNDLTREAESKHQDLVELYRKYGVDFDNPRGLTPGTAAPTSAMTRVMTNPQGQTVNVPADRVAEAVKAGYK